MGIQQSSMQCTNEKDKCSYGQPVSYKDYMDYVKTLPKEISEDEKQKQINMHICGKNPGIVTQCCNKNNPNANELASTVKYIKKIYDASGNIVEYNTCDCMTDVCHNMNCPDFTRMTNYDLCKARATDSSKIINVNKYINKLQSNDAYIDCYDLCK